MEKPKNYENTQIVGDYEKLEVGVYKCKILKAEELKASNGKEYLKVSFDIIEGDKKDFFTKKYKGDTREDKKWGGVLVIFAEDFEGNTNRYFKTLITSVEASNKGFKFDFEKPALLAEKKVGIVFREEEFEDSFGQVKEAVKPFRACVYDKVEETKTPNKKPLKGAVKEQGEYITVADDEELPF